MGSPAEILTYRIDDACRALSLSQATIYRLIKAGKIKPIRIVGRTLIPRSEIDRLIAEAA